MEKVAEQNVLTKCPPTLITAVINRRTDLHALNNFSSSIDKISRPCTFQGVVHANIYVDTAE